MKANELRIGNFVTGPMGEEEVSCGGLVAQVQCELAEGELFAPIPLTEDWLLKFGCVKNDDAWDGGANYWNQEMDFSIDVVYVRSDNGIQPLFYYVLSEAGTGRKKHLLYVHQLQNLYYALTGEELKLNVGDTLK